MISHGISFVSVDEETFILEQKQKKKFYHNENFANEIRNHVRLVLTGMEMDESSRETWLHVKFQKFISYGSKYHCKLQLHNKRFFAIL